MKGHEKKHERAIAEESSIIFVHLLSCFMGIQNMHNSKSAFWCRELEMGATRLGDGALLSWAQFGLLFYNFRTSFYTCCDQIQEDDILMEDFVHPLLERFSVEKAGLRGARGVPEVGGAVSDSVTNLVTPQDDKPLEPGMLPVRCPGDSPRIWPWNFTQGGCNRDGTGM